MTELFQNKKKLTVNIAITLCYAIFTIFIVLNHEVWVDEVQVWQISKYLSVSELLKHLCNEGHPSFFYLLLMPFAKLNCSIIAMQIICWISTVAGVFLLLQFSPFKWWCKLAIILSAGFMYFFPVIARSYSLLPFLVFLAAILYEKRKEQPILYGIVLFLISQVHVIMFTFSSVLTMFFGIEAKQENNINKKTITAFSIMCFGLLAVILQLFTTIGDNSCLSRFVFKKSIFISVLYRFFSNTINDTTGIPLIASILVGGYFVYLLINMYKNSKRIFWLTAISLGFQFFIYITVYGTFIYSTRIFSAYLILIFGYWIILKQKDIKSELKLNIILALFFALTINNGIINCINDFKYPYSGSKEMAEFIRNNVDKNAVILYQYPNIIIPIIYYLPDYKMLYSPYEEVVRYAVWDNRLGRLMPTSSWTKFLNRFQKEYPDEKNIYILQSYSYYTPVENAETIYITEGYKANFENYILLKYTPQE